MSGNGGVLVLWEYRLYGIAKMLLCATGFGMDVCQATGTRGI